MTIQVYTHSEQEKKALLDFLKDGHYNYKLDDNDPLLQDEEFLDEYNKELDEAEAEIKAGNFFAHEEVVEYFAQRKKRRSEN